MDEEKAVEKNEGAVSLGQKFAALREKSGLTQNDIATRIHVCQVIIQSIENDNMINVPTVFLRGYIKSYAEIVGLPKDEYQPFLDMRKKQLPVGKMKNYSHKEQNKRKGKRLFLFSFFLILLIIGVALFFVWKDNRVIYAKTHPNFTSELSSSKS